MGGSKYTGRFWMGVWGGYKISYIGHFAWEHSFWGYKISCDARQGFPPDLSSCDYIVHTLSRSVLAWPQVI